ncbi:MAG TPA: sugar phosphate nucleotidyltransferase [Patescibacteria group bacterium]|nr:sugar phosphate nucleotidyltransferase [Patescibacteria group bacterium]
MKIIVTAGGQGTKLWPYSRENRPKQFQPIVGDTTLCTETIQILLKKFAAEDIFISSKRKFIKFISEQAPEIPLKNYIIEPDAAKDRGPGEGLAFLKLSMKFPDEPFFLVQIDCIREPQEAFLQMIEDACKTVEQTKRFLTGGIKATEPDMGIDYLELGDPIPTDSKQEIYVIGSYIQRKSTYRETKELVESYHVVKHCNHLCWYPNMILDAYKQYRPDWYEALMKIKDVIDQPGEDAAIEAIYNEMEKGPTEEVTRHIMDSGEAGVILLPFRWTDVGTWGSVYEFFTSGDGIENYEGGKVVTVNTTGSLIKTSSDKKLVAVAGVEDLVIVDTEDVLLIVPKNKIENIKEIQNILKEKGEKEYL